MNAEEKVVQYLSEAHATEQALVRTLQAHISMTPKGTYRSGLERHLQETEDHAHRVQERLGELGEGKNIVEQSVGAGVSALQSLLGQALALSKGPLDAVRGQSGEEKMLKNLKDECATEALEISTYEALEHLARSLGDERTAELAADIRADEERMLENLRGEIPSLTDAVIRSEIEGEEVYDISKTGLADAAKEGRRRFERTAREAAGRAESTARSTARQARRVPGVAQAEGEVKGAVASEEDLPIKSYEDLNANEVIGKLGDLSQIDLAKVDAYERKNQNRKTVLRKIESLRGDEPWPGYDEQTVGDIKTALAGVDDDKAREVRDYERSHKERPGVIEASERELSRT